MARSKKPLTRKSTVMHADTQLMQRGIHELQRGNLPAAQAVCARILASAPRDAEALNLQGMIAHRRGDFARAVSCYDAAIAAKPDAAGYHNNLGVSLHAMGRIHEAANAYRQAAALNPKSAQIQFNLGNTLRELGSTEEAIIALREAIRLQSDAPEFHYGLGVALAAALKMDEAAEVYRTAVRLRPDYVDAWINLGNALQALGQKEAAVEAHLRAVALRPASADTHNSLALSLYGTGDLEGSLREFRQAATLRPGFASAWSNLANVLRDVGQVHEAVAAYRRAISIQVDHPDARKNLALVQLLLGDYANGFLEYEWRFKVAGALKRKFERPQWAGEDPGGKTIFIHEEQGFGDVIQFARYASVLANRGAKVLLGCRPQLGRLMAGCAGVSQVVVAGQRLPPFDLHCPMLSLPLFCQTTTLASVSGEVPYIRLDDGVLRPWRERVPPTQRRKVGLCWAGNPENRNDRYRSIPLEKFVPLAADGEVEFHSLQFGPAAIERTRVSGLILADHEADVTDFADTAALIEQLDLVITVDTAVAHLAGALGKPVWILIHSAPDWRWLLDRTDSPWYPSARLFRQREGWDEVIEELAVQFSLWLSR